MKEMDLILGPFSDTQLVDMPEPDLIIYDQLLNENDQEIYKWITGQTLAPKALRSLIETIAVFAKAK